MILLVHMVFGTALGYAVYINTQSIVLATLFSLLGHYFLDLFPHIEYLESVESSIGKMKFGGLQRSLIDMAKVLLDFLLGLLIIFLVSNNNPIIYFYTFITLIPDGLTVVSNLFKNKVLAGHDWFHQKVHFLKHKKISKVWRISTQVVAVIMGIVLLRA